MEKNDAAGFYFKSTLLEENYMSFTYAVDQALFKSGGPFACFSLLK